MADLGIGIPDLEFSSLKTGLAGAAGTGYIVMLWTLGFLAIAAIIWLIWFLRSYKHQVIIMQVTSNRNIVIIDRARNIKDKSGMKWWKLQKMKDKIPEPPAEAIQITQKGKKVFHCYHLEDAGYIPAKDAKKYNKTFTQKSLEEEKPYGYVGIQNNLSYKEFKEHLTEEFDPFDTNQRSLLINDLVEADRYKKKKLSEVLMFATPFITLVIIIALLLGFWGDVVEPFTENNKLAVKAMETANNLIREMRLLESGAQVISPAVEALNNSGVPN